MPVVHVPAFTMFAVSVTVHAVPSALPAHGAAPALHVTPVPSVLHTLLPLTAHTPSLPLVHGIHAGVHSGPVQVVAHGKSSSMLPSQSSSSPLHVSERIEPSMICEI